jgi:hypothetical protein
MAGWFGRSGVRACRSVPAFMDAICLPKPINGAGPRHGSWARSFASDGQKQSTSISSGHRGRTPGAGRQGRSMAGGKWVQQIEVLDCPDMRSKEVEEAHPTPIGQMMDGWANDEMGSSRSRPPCALESEGSCHLVPCLPDSQKLRLSAEMGGCTAAPRRPQNPYLPQGRCGFLQPPVILTLCCVTTHHKTQHRPTGEQ